MEFHSKRFKVTAILKKTQSKGFKDIKTKDHLNFKIKLENTTGASGNGIYATNVIIMHEESGTYWSNSQNAFLKNISNFKLTEANF